MKKNFILSSSISIEYSGKHIDLHNDFEFRRLKFNIEDRRCDLLWVGRIDKSFEEKVEFLITIKNATSFSVRPRDSGYPPSEDKILSFMGYLHPDDIDVMDGFFAGRNVK
jgi:hypothetical protein